MSTSTRILACNTTKEAEDKAAEFNPANGWKVAILGPTPDAYLKDEDDDRAYWSLNDDKDITIVIATKSGLDVIS